MASLQEISLNTVSSQQNKDVEKNSNNLKLLAHATGKTCWLVKGEGYFEKANFWNSCIESIKGSVGLVDRTDKILFEYELIKFLALAIGKDEFKRKDLHLVKMAARQAGLLRGNHRSEREHTDLSTLVNLIAKHILEHEILPADCYLAYAGRFYRNHERHLKSLTTSPLIKSPKGSEQNSMETHFIPQPLSPFAEKKKLMIRDEESSEKQELFSEQERDPKNQGENDQSALTKQNFLQVKDKELLADVSPDNLKNSSIKSHTQLKKTTKRILSKERDKKLKAQASEKRKKINKLIAVASSPILLALTFVDFTNTLDHIYSLLSYVSKKTAIKTITLKEISNFSENKQIPMQRNEQIRILSPAYLKTALTCTSLALLAFTAYKIYFIFSPKKAASQKEEEIKVHLNLETAVQDVKVIQDFELESLPVEGDHKLNLPINSDPLPELSNHKVSEDPIPPPPNLKITENGFPVVPEITPAQIQMSLGKKMSRIDLNALESHENQIVSVLPTPPSLSLAIEHTLNAPDDLVSSNQNSNRITSPIPLTTKFLTTTKKTVLSDIEIRSHNRRTVDKLRILNKLTKEFTSANKKKNLNNHESGTWKKNKKAPVQKDSTEFFKGKVGVSWAQGKRETMEDAHLHLKLNVRNSSYKRIPLFGIFDGHRGNECAEFLKNQVPIYLNEKLPEALKDSNSECAIFNLLKTMFVELGDKFDYEAGSTANIILYIDQTLWVCNVGDTRSIIVTKDKEKPAIALSEDAKPGLEKYKRGAEKRGGVVADNEETGFVPRVSKNNDAMMSVARAVGHDEIDSGINPRGKIIKYTIKDAETINKIVIACDGLWDVVSSNQVAKSIQKYVKNGSSCMEIARKLVKRAYANGSEDNISVLVISGDLFKPIT